MYHLCVHDVDKFSTVNLEKHNCHWLYSKCCHRHHRHDCHFHYVASKHQTPRSIHSYKHTYLFIFQSWMVLVPRIKAKTKIMILNMEQHQHQHNELQPAVVASDTSRKSVHFTTSSSSSNSSKIRQQQVVLRS